MNITALENQLKDVNEQWHIALTQTDTVTEVRWVYGGFDIYEYTSAQPTYRKTRQSTLSQIVSSVTTPRSRTNKPMYHVIAQISEVREHDACIELNASELPADMRYRVLPILSDYISTKLNDRRYDDTAEPQVIHATAHQDDETQRQVFDMDPFDDLNDND